MFRMAAFVVFAGLYIALVIPFLQKDDPSSLEVSRVFRHLTTLLLLAYFIFRPYLNVCTIARRLWSDPKIRRPLRGTISNQGITFGESYTMALDKFVTKREDVDVVVLLTADRTMAMVPQSLFKYEYD